MICREVLSTLLLLTTGSLAYGAECVSTPNAQPHATLVIYRPHNQYGMLVGTDIYLDDARVCRLSNGRFFVAPALPGQHQLRVGSERAIPFDVKPGNAYYFRVNTTVSLCCKPQSGFHIQISPAQVASADLVNVGPQTDEMKLPALAPPDVGVPVQQ